MSIGNDSISPSSPASRLMIRRLSRAPSGKLLFVAHMAAGLNQGNQFLISNFLEGV